MQWASGASATPLARDSGPLLHKLIHRTRGQPRQPARPPPETPRHPSEIIPERILLLLPATAASDCHATLTLAKAKPQTAPMPPPSPSDTPTPQASPGEPTASGIPPEPKALPGEALSGAALIRAELPTLPQTPGVYRMEAEQGTVLYVGKAKNLRRRVAAYARPERLGGRMARAVAATRRLEVITTVTEAEALLLESNLIKRLKPRYNLLLRDDKSFPHIRITASHAWPQITKHRGARHEGDEYFGPFASAGAVNATLAQLGRAFPLRSCPDSVFEGRTRPCLQYQIKRCTAPCVGRIGHEDYQRLVGEARDFLNGQSRAVQERLARSMEEASARLDYETAAVYRDRIRALSRIQERQDINLAGLGDADVIALFRRDDHVCVQVFFFRAGQNFGNRAYFPTSTADLSEADVLEGFLGQFYASHPPPPLILTSHAVSHPTLMADALRLRAGARIVLRRPARGPGLTAIAHAAANAEAALSRRLAENASQIRLLEALAERLDLAEPPQRIEVYDNSHLGGRGALGAMIVAGPDGFEKAGYRRFTIRDPNLAPGDDYAMLREVLRRRFSRALKEAAEGAKGEERRTGWPDLLLIDGGAGQLATAHAILADLGITDLPVVGIAKGPERHAGRERLFLAGRPPIALPHADPVLHFLQRLRDEAHRFAITGQRAVRSRAITRSELDDIQGIGPSRKRALVAHFGSARGVSEARLEDLRKVPGISEIVARRIHDHFRSP